ncbi:hypothetical protein [Paenibacillus herberti]|uniref:Uncharacterized protein n=1 Tax=Paenibacillus herberti TaxID=1619309 RepID=A0A229P0N3_9BACL|nr:hypothetical protein [Paenibacillus herberti]OXM15449.1 hypothetical protein CGZ75_01530 [Paenibacillus herberti]
MSHRRGLRRELVAYNALRSNRLRIQEYLSTRDQDINPKQQRLDGMPTARGGLPRSIIERMVIDRQEQLDRLEAITKRLELRFAPLEAALRRLSWTERESLRLFYWTLSEPHEAAREIGVSEARLEAIRKRALHQLEWLYNQNYARVVGEGEGIG